MSVVDGKKWEELKRYNLNEMYRLQREEGKNVGEGDEKDEVKKVEDAAETEKKEEKTEAA